MKNKRGSHVGVIISFVAFIVFLMFLYFIFEPAIKQNQNKQSLVDNLKINLIEYVSAEMTLATITSGGSGPCLKLDRAALELDGSSCVVKDENGDIINSQITGNDLEIDWGGGESFFKVYCSDESFTNYLSSCASSVDDSTPGLIKTEKHIFETKIIQAINSDYDVLKTALSFPESNNFGFNFTYNNGSSIGTPEKDMATSIYVEDVPIIYVDQDANITSGMLSLRVW